MSRKKDTIKLLKTQSIVTKTYILQLAKRASKGLQLKIIIILQTVKTNFYFFNVARFNVFINKSLQFILLPE